ncbi:MAG TPA: FtsX-like permease family protein, partial [Steroidobacteraceae bacterium]|nr:FtsX-like permease family protein [Steroidobacteraceae bacterium]
QVYQIVGVVQAWHPQPTFYDLGSAADEVYIPYSTAIAHHVGPIQEQCNTPPGLGWAGLVSSECQWVEFWVDLPTKAALASYRQWLSGYTSQQHDIGRFSWTPAFSLYDVREWLKRQQVVPDQVRAATIIGSGFLVVCLLNAMSLILARFSDRIGNFSLHRALGAPAAGIFAQCLTETAVLGGAASLVGLFLIGLGLQIERTLLGPEVGSIVRLDPGLAVGTLIVAEVATVLCGVYPGWRVCRSRSVIQARAS